MAYKDFTEMAVWQETMKLLLKVYEYKVNRYHFNHAQKMDHLYVWGLLRKRWTKNKTGKGCLKNKKMRQIELKKTEGSCQIP